MLSLLGLVAGSRSPLGPQRHGLADQGSPEAHPRGPGQGERGVTLVIETALFLQLIQGCTQFHHQHHHHHGRARPIMIARRMRKRHHCGLGIHLKFWGVRQ